MNSTAGHANFAARQTLIVLSIYAVAMALLEAAVVVYMRRLYYPENPLELFPLQFLNHYDPALELSREAATIAMILAVAFLAKQQSVTRYFAAFVFVFGVWDLFYYLWLKVLIDWPRTWLEWDVLFLIPAVWLGPWICPAAIAALFAIWGGWTLCTTRNVAFTPKSSIIFATGAGLGLIAFMQPALGQSTQQLSQYTPGRFWWWLFGISYGMMTLAFAMTCCKERQTGSLDSQSGLLPNG